MDGGRIDVLDFKKSKLNVHHCLLPGRITWHAELPPPGIEPASPALAGGFLTTGPPGSPRIILFLTYLKRLHK